MDGSSEFVQVDNEALASANKAVLSTVGVPNIFGDFLSNAITRGLSAGSAADETFKLMSSGKELSDEDIQEYIKVNKLSEAMGQSDEMKAFNEKYDEDVKNGDSGIWAFMKGIYENPKVAGEVAITSMAQMAASGLASGETAAMVAAGAGAGAGIGAAAGAIGGPLAPVSSTIGAIGGTIKGAMAAAGGITEVAASFTEFLRTELDGKEFTQENIRKVLADEEAKQRIINKSLARGATVAAIDFLAAGAAGKAVSSIKSVGRTGKALKGVTATGIESLGGATGETAARLVTGQELDTKEILFEAVGEAPGAVVSGPIGMLSAPKYSINNSRLTKKDFLKVVETATDQELLDMNIKIDNDEGMSDVFNERIKKANIKKDIDPTITDEKDIDTVVDLELKIKDLKNRKTSSAKNKVKQLEQQIKDIQSKYDSVDSETTEATPTEEAITEDKEPLVTEEKKQTVADVINRPVTLFELAGSKLETPIVGDLYVEGQQLVVEEANGNITELGNVDELSNKTTSELGIDSGISDVSVNPEGNIVVGDKAYTIQNDLPTDGIVYDADNNITEVSIKDETGKPVMFKGQTAVDIGYQILLDKATSPEQAQFINEQLENDAEFQNEFTETTEPTQAETNDVPQQDAAAGNKLINEPLPDATRISDEFTGRKGIDPTGSKPIRPLKEDKSNRIAKAFDKLKSTPDDPKTKRAYAALISETIEQFNDIIAAGYSVVMDNKDGYNSSKEMIEDLRKNKSMKIFSTEEGFGSDKITDKQREENPMLADSGFKDANGKPMLVNDVFRFVHDFFGHAKEGNSFGPKGEEIAWQVHSRMYSPDARRALTTETRGQNSWVNFSGVNEKAFKSRDKARELRKLASETTDVKEKKRLLKQAKALVDKAYADMKFAEQKIGLLPDEFVFNLDEEVGQDQDAIIEKGVELGFDDQAILENLKDAGFDPNESSRLLKEYRKKVRIEGQKREGISVEGESKVVRLIKNAYKASLAPRGFLPRSMMIAKEVLQGMIDVELRQARINIRELEKKLSKYKKEELREVVNNIDAYIRGDENVTIDENLLDVVNTMRDHVDNLSRKLIESGAVEPGADVDRIKANLGSYLNRSYKLYDKENYKESVSEKVLNDAKRKLREIYIKEAEAEAERTGVDVESILTEKVDAIVEGILSQDEANAFVSSSKPGSKNLNVFKKKKDIPAEIRALMGEYGDPAFNYIQSVNKIQNIVANQLFLNKMKEVGEGVFFFKQPTGEATVEVAAKGSKTYNPLNGYYTTRDIKDALDSKERISMDFGKYGNKLVDFYMNTLMYVKKTKTVYSVGTQSKNVIGIVPVLIANGYVTDFSSFETAFKSLSNDLRGLNDAEMDTKMKEYLSLGIVGSNVVVQEIKSMRKKGETFEDAMLKRLTETDETILNKSLSGAIGLAKKADKALTTAYQATDDFSKILGYEVEKKRYAKALFGKEYSALTESKKQQINERSAEIVKNNIPNYGRVGGAVKALKALPFSGTFISFHVEAIRTAFNTVNLAVEEVKDPKTRSIGISRLSGVMAVSATATVLPALFGLASIGDDEEEESDAMKAARIFFPDWDKNSSVIISDQPKDGKFSYISLSASDPYGALSQAVNAYISGDSMAEGMVKAIGELVSPFFDEDMLFGTIKRVVQNEKKNGMPLVTEGDTFFEAADKRITEFFDVLKPGTVTSFQKILETKESIGKEVLGQLTGFKPRKIDIPLQTKFKTYAIKDRVAEARRDYNSVKNKYRKGEDGVTRDDVRAEYIKINEKQKEIYSELIDIYNAALYLNTPKELIIKSMKEAKISNELLKGIVRGKIPDMSL